MELYGTHEATKGNFIDDLHSARRWLPFTAHKPSTMA